MQFINIVKASITQMIAEDGLMVAGYMSFAALLSLFPFLLFLAAFLSFLGTQDQIDQIVSLLFDNLPEQMAEGLAPVIQEVLAGRKGGFLTFGAVVALWAASNGVEALRVALNRAYGVTKQRPFWLKRLQSLLFVAIAAMTALVISILILAGPILWRVADNYLGLDVVYAYAWGGFRYFISISMMIVVLIALHLALPNRAAKLKAVMPGVLASVLLFIIAATAFSLYLQHFASYSVTYGSLAGVVIALMFFYLTSIIFIFGGYLNRNVGQPGQP